MQLDRSELQLLLLAARQAAYAARAEEHERRMPTLGGAAALERLATRLERELVTAGTVRDEARTEGPPAGPPAASRGAGPPT
jgi:hypothetical protein